MALGSASPCRIDLLSSKENYGKNLFSAFREKLRDRPKAVHIQKPPLALTDNLNASNLPVKNRKSIRKKHLANRYQVVHRSPVTRQVSESVRVAAQPWNKYASRASIRQFIQRKNGMPKPRKEKVQGQFVVNRTVEFVKSPIKCGDPSTKLLFLSALGLAPRKGVVLDGPYLKLTRLDVAKYLNSHSKTIIPRRFIVKPRVLDVIDLVSSDDELEEIAAKIHLQPKQQQRVHYNNNVNSSHRLNQVHRPFCVPLPPRKNVISPQQNPIHVQPKLQQRVHYNNNINTSNRLNQVHRPFCVPLPPRQNVISPQQNPIQITQSFPLIRQKSQQPFQDIQRNTLTVEEYNIRRCRLALSAKHKKQEHKYKK